MRSIEELIGVRADKAAAADYRAALEDLEAKRNYEARIARLLEDVARMEAGLAARDGELGRLASQYRPLLEAAEEELGRVKSLLRALLDRVGEMAEWRLSGDNEVAIYSSLLGFEEDRIEACSERVSTMMIYNGIKIQHLNITQRTVTVRQSVVNHEERESYVEERVSVKSMSSSDDEKVG